MMNRTRTAVLGAALALCACGDSAEAPEQPESAAAQIDDGGGALARVRAFLDEQTPLVDRFEAGIDRRLPEVEFTDAEGELRRLSDLLDGKALVVAVRREGDELADRYGPRLDELRSEYSERGVRFLWIAPGGELPDRELPDRESPDRESPGRESPDRDPVGAGATLASDADGSIARALGVEASAAAFIVDASRTLRYRGAVDDQHGRGVELAAPRRHYLREALEAVLADEQVAVPATAAPGAPLAYPRSDRVTEAIPTYHGSIARVLQSHCVSCHHEGGAGPFALDGFESSYDRRRMIALVVEEGLMPPWYAESGSVRFHNDARMPADDRALLAAWVEAGAPEGDSADGPVRLNWGGGPDGWSIGAPDEIFELHETKSLPAEGTIEWDPIPADRTAPRDLWVQRIQVRPTDPSVVHHCNVYFRPPAEYAQRAPGSSKGWQRLAGYLPGKDPVRFPPGLAKFVPAGSELMFDMHYTPQGRATTDRTRVGLVLADEPPRFMPTALIVRQPVIEIPPHTAKEFTAELEVPKDTAILSIGPHMHLRGSSVEVDLIDGAGASTRLLNSVWDPDWQFTYLLAEEVVIRGGSRLFVRGRFDNTTGNANNPDPDAWVLEGPQSWDEMLLVAIGTIHPREDPVVFRGGWPEIPTMTDGAKARDERRGKVEGPQAE